MRPAHLVIAALLLAAVVAAFNGVISWRAHQESSTFPTTGGDRVLNHQIVEPTGPHRGTAILLHGFVGSPHDFTPLIGDLAAIGYRVDVPMLPGQSRLETLSERGQVSCDELILWTRDLVLRETHRSGSKPVLIGISMGGTLATILGAEGLVDQLVLLAPYFELPTANDGTTALASMLKWIVPAVPKLKKGMINNPEGYEGYEPGTSIISLRGFLAVQELANRARPVVPDLKIETLVIHSPHDRIASYRATRDLFTPLPYATIVDAPRSDHLILYDYDQETVVQAILAFLERGSEDLHRKDPDHPDE